MDTPGQALPSLGGHTILLVEDNEDEVFMMQRAFRKANILNPLQVAIDGIEAVDYLEGRGKFADRGKFAFPSVVFMDLNLPKKGGLEVLEYVKKQPLLKRVVINILSSSTRPADIESAALLGANAYFIKPSRIEKFQELVVSWYALAQFEAFTLKL
jgi:CheY-like chemotaxis protein